MADEDSHSTDSNASGGKGYSDPLRVAAEGGARLSTPVSHLDELHVCIVVYKSIPRVETF